MSSDPLSVREMPLFPLPVVLFPGAMLPLHIFEERYKQMIKDCLEGEKIFGICFHGANESWPPNLGRIGAIAQILAVVPLEEGRMNILTSGSLRFRTLRYTEQQPYLKVEVETFRDDLDDNANALMAEVRSLYERASVSLKELNEDQIPLSELPEMPEEFSFAIASSLQIPLDKKQSLLELRSTVIRLKSLRKHLIGVIDEFEARAQIHSRAKLNGHGSAHLLKEIDKLTQE